MFVATITSLGFSIFSRYDGTGVRQARRDLRDLKNDLDAANAANNRLAQSTRALRSEHDALGASIRRMNSDLSVARSRADSYAASVRNATSASTAHRNEVNRNNTALTGLDGAFRRAAGSSSSFSSSTNSSRSALAGMRAQSDSSRNSVGGLAAALDRASASARTHATASNSVTHSHQTMAAQTRSAAQALTGLGNNTDSARTRLAIMNGVARSSGDSINRYGSNASTASARTRGLDNDSRRLVGGLIGAGGGGERGGKGLRSFGDGARDATLNLRGFAIPLPLVVAGVTALSPVAIAAGGALLGMGAALTVAGIGFGAFFLAMGFAEKEMITQQIRLEKALTELLFPMRKIVEAPFKAWVDALIPRLPLLVGPVHQTSDALVTLAHHFSKVTAEGTPFSNSWLTINNAIRPVTESLGKALINFLVGVLNLVAALVRTGLVQQLSDGVLHMSESFKRWTETLDTNKGFQNFIAAVKRDGPIVMQLIGALAQAFGHILMSLEPLGNPMLKIATAMANLIAAMPPQVIQAIAVGFMAWKLAMGPIAQIMSGVSTGLQILRFAAFAFEISLSSMILIVLAVVVALVALGVGIFFLVKNWDTVSAALKTAWNATWNFIKMVALAVWNALKIAWSATAHAFVVAWQAVSAAFIVAWTYTWNFLKTVAMAIWSGLQIAWSAFVTGLSTAWTAVSTALVIAWNFVWNGIGTVARTIWSGLQFAWSAFITGLSIVWTTVSTALVIAWNAVWNGIGFVARAVWNGLTVAWAAFVNGLRTVGVAVWTGIQIAWQTFVNVMRTIFNIGIGAISASWSVIWNAVRAVGIAIWTGIQIAWQVFVNVMRTIFNVGIGAIHNSWNVVWNAIKVAGQAIWNALGAAWSVLWNFMRNVFNIGAGAIHNSWNVVWGAIRTAATAIWNALGAAWSVLWNFMRNVFNIGAGAIHNSWNVVWNAIKAAGQAIWNALGAAWSVLWNFMRNVFNIGAGAIHNSWNVVWNAIKAAGQAIWNALGAAWSAFWSFMRNAFNIAMGAIHNSWNVIWNAIKAFGQATWNALGAAWGVLWAFMRNAFNAAMSALTNSWHAAWNALRAFTQTTWNALGAAWGVLWNFFRNAFNASMSALSNSWHNAWNALKNFSTALWDFLGKKFGEWKSFMVKATDDAVHLIGQAWHEIENLFKAPIRFVIQTVINGGVIGALSWVLEKLGFSKGAVKPFPLPKGFSHGGAVQGKGTKTSDSIPARLSRDEFVIRASSAKDIGYGNLAYMNQHGKMPAGNAMAQMCTGGKMDASHFAGNFCSGGKICGGKVVGSAPGYAFGGQVSPWPDIAGVAMDDMFKPKKSSIWDMFVDTIKSLGDLAFDFVTGGPKTGIQDPGKSPLGDVATRALNAAFNVATLGLVKGAAGISNLAKMIAPDSKLAQFIVKSKLKAVTAPDEPRIFAFFDEDLQGGTSSANKVADFLDKQIDKIPASGRGFGMSYSTKIWKDMAHGILNGPGGATSSGGGGIAGTLSQANQDAQAGIQDQINQASGNRTEGPNSTKPFNGLRAPFVAMFEGFFNQIPQGGATGFVPFRAWRNGDDVHTSWKGCTVNVRTRDMLNKAQGLLGSGMSCYQGSFSSSVGASAGTHSGGGAADVGPPTMDTVGAMRASGFAAWLRTRKEGFSPHVHGIAVGDPTVSPQARDQVSQFFAGKNGLADKGPDTYIPTAKFLKYVTGGAGVAGNCNRWIPLAQRALAMAGVSAGQLGKFMALMKAESNCNPSAINLSDINAKRGDPSRGLMQVIGSTFNAFHCPGTSGNIFDPLANMCASARYIKSRYGGNVPGSPYGIGTPGGQKGWHLVGEMGPEMVRFRGGERVENWRNLKDAVRRGGGHGDVHVSVPVHVSGNLDPAAVDRLETKVVPKLRMMLQQQVGRNG